MSSRKESTDTRTKLLDAGMRCFLLHGFHGTGIKTILDLVGVPKGSFYNYFESKDAFGVATIEHYADGIGARMAEALDQAENPLEALRGFFVEEMRGFEREGFVGGCLVANLGGELENSDLLREALAMALGRYLDGISQTLGKAQKLGLIRQDLSPDELGRFLVDSWEGAVIRMKIERSTQALEDCLKHQFEGFLLKP